jgi:hypothetical protein
VNTDGYWSTQDSPNDICTAIKIQLFRLNLAFSSEDPTVFCRDAGAEWKIHSPKQCVAKIKSTKEVLA